jgi:hypothetical protein
LGLRLTTLNLNDAMIRTLLFMPLYTKFLMEIQRCTLWIYFVNRLCRPSFWLQVVGQHHGVSFSLGLRIQI